MPFGLLKRLFHRDEGRDALIPLYRRAVEIARDPSWYVAGKVADTIDGRFDMLAAITSLLLIRFEGMGEDGKRPGVLLTELFIEDMDGQLRQDGVGDVVVGKHIGRMMAALGGRLTAYRETLPNGNLDGALTRNMFRGEVPDSKALGFVADRLRHLHAQIAATDIDQLLAGQIAL